MPARAPTVQRHLFMVRILLPTALTILLFLAGIFLFVVPVIERNSLDHKKEMIRELTNAAGNIISRFEQDERRGRGDNEDRRERLKARLAAPEDCQPRTREEMVEGMLFGQAAMPGERSLPVRRRNADAQRLVEPEAQLTELQPAQRRGSRDLSGTPQISIWTGADAEHRCLHATPGEKLVGASGNARADRVVRALLRTRF